MGNIGGNVVDTFYYYYYYYYYLIRFLSFIVFFIFTFIESNLNNTTIKIKINT